LRRISTPRDRRRRTSCLRAPIRPWHAGLCIAALVSSLSAQSLDPRLIEEIRRGPAETGLVESVSVPIAGTPTLPLLETVVNGRGPFRLLIDFGSNVTLLRSNVAAEAQAQMVVDREKNDILRVSEMRIGKATFRDVVVGGTENLDVDGVLAYNFFRGLLVDIDYPGMEVRLRRGQLPAPDGDEVLSLEIQERMPHLSVLVGDQRLLVNFDTGASDWVVLPANLKDRFPFQKPPVPGPTTWNNQTGWTRVEIARLADDLRFGRYTVATPRVHIDPAASFPFFGSALLRKFRLTFDIPGQRVRIQGPPAPIPVPGYRTFGIRLSRSAKAWSVADVIPGSRAAGKGIRPGDVVIALENVRAEDLTPDAWRSFQEERPKISIELSRGGRRRTYLLPAAVLGGTRSRHPAHSIASRDKYPFSRTRWSIQPKKSAPRTR
jgi:hypothetical protein